MAFKFILVVVAVFIINLGTGVAEEHDDCYNYEAKAPNGKKIIDIYHEFGVNDGKTFQDPKLFKCIVEAFQVTNDDGTFKRGKMKHLMKKYADPKYNDKIQDMVDEILKKPPEDFYTAYPKELAKICPNDQFNRDS